MTDDERIKRLQRLAYGADAPDVERASAVAELAELSASGSREALPATPEADAAAGAAAAETRPDESGTDSSRPDAGPGPPTAPDDRSRPHRVRQGVAVGAVALLLGAAVGMAVSRQAPEPPEVETVGAAPNAPAFGSGEPGTALPDTDLLQLFDRLPPVADPSRVEQAVQDIDPGSVRLLATRTDGPAAYLARTLDGSDVCLVLLLPAGPSPSTCTMSGLLPAEGLRIRFDADGYGFAIANLNASGTVTLGLIVGY